MKCLFCNGRMERAFISHTIDRKGYHLFIEQIPANACTQCGERCFEEKEVKAIEKMIKALEEKLKDVLLAA